MFLKPQLVAWKRGIYDSDNTDPAGKVVYTHVYTHVFVKTTSRLIKKLDTIVRHHIFRVIGSVGG